MFRYVAETEFFNSISQISILFTGCGKVAVKISQRIELFFVLGVHFRTGEPQWQAYTEPEPGQKIIYIVDRGSQMQVDEDGVYLVEFAHTVLSGSTLSIISVFIIEKVACSTRLVNFKWINSTWIAIETKGNLVTRYVASSPAHQELIGGSPWASNGVSRWKIGLLGVVLWEDNLRIIQVKPLKPVYVERKVDMTIPRRGPSQ